MYANPCGVKHFFNVLKVAVYTGSYTLAAAAAAAYNEGSQLGSSPYLHVIIVTHL